MPSAGQLQEPRADEDTPRFNIFEIRVRGNTVLDNRSIESAVYRFLGTGRSIDDVEAARSVLETAYRDAGFSTALVSIPEQTVDSGIVRLEVTEGRIGRIRVRNARYVSGRDIRAAIGSVEPGNPVYFPDLQQDLRKINRMSADRSVTPILKPGRVAGEVDLELRVNDRLPLHGSLEINDRFTADTARLRSTASLSYDNLWQAFHSLALQYTTAPENPDNSEVLAATYLWRFEQSPNLLAFYAVDTNSDVATVGDINVLGVGRIYGSRFVFPFSGGDAFFHSLTLGADYKDFNETIGEELQTPISYSNLGAVYGFGWNRDRHRSSFNLGLNFGLRQLGNSPREFGDKRFKAKPNYFYLTLGTDQLFRLPLGIGLYGSLNGQYTTGPLISNEQFSAGGAGGGAQVRGYLQAERLGDYGAVGNIEVRSPDFGSRLARGIDEFYLLAFYDAAALGLHEALPGQDDYFELFSAGLGFRLAVREDLRASFDWAWPLLDSTNVQADDTRVHFSLQWGF